jgi:hypothetical protein
MRILDSAGRPTYTEWTRKSRGVVLPHVLERERGQGLEGKVYNEIRDIYFVISVCEHQESSLELTDSSILT